ncbi:hypothetical protein EJ02DRAFT_447022 [Clathrospora elynae]|uniref:Uncharacterized protein n=1 Tax=Clathrospora elynae TaxID=706981 RepID=A0A6A5SEG8_9PLEO|nr:hypothetical protein EJ02DRAFT_447022 [Clathrospora elynae]
MSDRIKSSGGSPNGVAGIKHLVDIKDSQATSPTSNSSGETLHDDGSSDARSNGDGTPSHSSPLSPNSLNFNNLTIDNGESRFYNGNGERYSNPFQRGLKLPSSSSPYGPQPRDFRRDGNHRQTIPYNGRAGGGGIRNSRTWMSPDAQAQQEFMVVRNSMRRLFKNSDVAKWKLSDYIAHREAMLAAKSAMLARQLKSKQEGLDLSPPIPLQEQQYMRKHGIEGNFDEHGNFGRVLGEQTIWCYDWVNGKDEIAPWPCMAEMKWEGDDRAKTGVGRFLPLPREEAPPTLQWNQLPVIEQYPMDQVCKIPTMEDVYLPVDYYIEEDMEYLWSKNLEKDIDTFLES